MKFSLPFSSLFVFSGLAGAVFAGSSPLPVSAPVPPVAAASDSLLPFPVQIEVEGLMEFLDDSSNGASGTVWRGEVSLPVYAPLAEGWTVAGMLNVTRSEYDTMPFRESGLDTWEMGILMAVTGEMTDIWSVTFGGIASLGFEDGSSIRSDSFNGGGFVGLGRRWSPNVQTTLGVLYLTRTNEDALAVPFIGLEWKVSDSVDIHIRGLEAQAEWRMTEEWSTFLLAEYDPNGGTLERFNGSVADSFEDETVRAGLGVRWSPKPGWSISAHGGVALHDTGLRDEQERVLSTERLDPAPYVAVKMTARF